MLKSPRSKGFGTKSNPGALNMTASSFGAAVQHLGHEHDQEGPEEDSHDADELLHHQRTSLVYPIARYQEDQSPTSIYMPHKTVLFSMMKACIGIEEVRDLWIFQAKTAEFPNNNGVVKCLHNHHPEEVCADTVE